MQGTSLQTVMQQMIKPLFDVKARPRSIEGGRLDYTRSLRTVVWSLWRGDMTTFEFLDRATSTIRRGFTRAFYEGAGECGVSPSELTPQETNVLQAEINQESLFLINFADTITNNSKTSGEKLRAHTERLPMWLNRYEMLRNLGRISACKDAKYQWIWNPVKEHCSDCGMLNGRVYRASVWNNSGWVPKGRNLECGGFKCGCEFVLTDLPITPGPVPKARL